MAVSVPAYNLNGQQIKELYGTTETPLEFYYGTGSTNQPSFELIQEDSFNIYFYRKTNTGQLYLMVVFNKYTPSRVGQPGGSISFSITGLSSGYNIEFTDDSSEAFTIVDSNTISNTYGWQRDLTDGFAIELIEPVNTLTIDVTAYNNINQFSFIDNDEKLYTIPFSQTTQLTIQPTQITYDGDIYLDPPAGIYQVPKTINVYLSNDVQDAIVTDDGTTPTLAEYIAYDDLNPPNPFIAVVQDGRGNVTFDGGFPKFYNTYAPTYAAENLDFEALRFSANCLSTSGNSYAYDIINYDPVTIQNGDTLEFEIYIENDANEYRASIGAAISDGSNLRDKNIVDQNGLRTHPSDELTGYADNKWYARVFDLSSLSGLSLNNWTVGIEADTQSLTHAYYRKAFIKDINGNIKFTIYDGSLGVSQILNSNVNNYTITVKETKVVEPAFKYFYNVLNFISNNDKVAAGNNKILFLGDSNSSESYNIKDFRSSDFAVSIERVCQLAGYEPVIRTSSDFGSTLNPSYSFLEEHCAVVLFSTKFTNASTTYMTSQAVNNLISYREAGNGIFIVTDHGTGPDGFYVTANQLANQFGAYFEGNYNRSPVNVGFLRTTYGDHPLYNNMSDQEFIFAGASESRVFVTEYPSYDNSTIPDQNLSNPGYISYKFLIRDVSSTLQSLNYTYGLQVAEIVNFLNEKDQVITSKNVGVSNRAQIDFQINDAGLGSINGLVKRNGIVVGDVFFDGTTQEVQYYRHDGNEIIVDDGDIISVEITSPLQYTKSLQIERFQPDVGDIYSYSRFLSEINNPEWFNQKVNRNEFSVLDNMNYNRSYRRAYNVERIRGYVNNTGELPEATALVYSDPTQAQNALATVSEPTQQDIFNQFGIFAAAGATQSYYPTKADAPATDPYSTWVYDTNLNAIVQTANTVFYTGFVSPEYLDRYVLEVTVTSPGGDDDLIGVVAAHYWDEVNGQNNTISFDVNNGGIFGNIGPIVANKNHRGNGEKVLGVSNHDLTYPTAQSAGGWSGKRMRVKVERNQNIIKMVATKWDVLDTYDPTSEIIIDLNADPDLSMFIGPKSYGYSSSSQASSTFENISFTGGVNYDFVVDMQQQIVYRYNVVTLQWESTGITVQDLYGYPRTVRNPNTGETFYITETSVTQIS